MYCMYLVPGPNISSKYVWQRSSAYGLIVNGIQFSKKSFSKVLQANKYKLLKSPIPQVLWLPLCTTCAQVLEWRGTIYLVDKSPLNLKQYTYSETCFFGRNEGVTFKSNAPSSLVDFLIKISLHRTTKALY